MEFRRDIEIATAAFVTNGCALDFMRRSVFFDRIGAR
jgi:hypothetical protein